MSAKSRHYAQAIAKEEADLDEFAAILAEITVSYANTRAYKRAKRRREIKKGDPQ